MLSTIRRQTRQLLGERGRSILFRAATTARIYPWYFFADGKARRPETVILEITYACNARCRMCAVHGEHADGSSLAARGCTRTGELTTGELQGVLSDVAAMGIPQVTFRGGEAFLRPDFCDLLEYAGQRGLRISIISNGTIMNDEIARRVIQAPTASMTISVDGPRAIHDTIRRVPGMLDRIESNIRCLRQAQRELGLSRPRIYINCTLSATNQGHLQGLVDIAARHQATLTLRPLFYTTERQQEQTNRLYRMGNAKPECQVLSPNLSHVNPSALAQELMKVRQYATSLKVDIRISLRNVRQIFNRFYRAYHADAGRCMHPWRVTTINPYGAVYPCSINTVMGDIRRQTLSQIWNGRKYVHFRQRLASVGIFPRCTKCCVLDADDLLARILPRGTNGGA